MGRSRYDRDPPAIDAETDSATDADTDSLFDSSDDDGTDTTSGADTGSPLEIVDDSDDDVSLFDDEVQHPPEHYLTKAANLDVQRLRRQRYDPKTLDWLDWVKDHCVQ